MAISLNTIVDIDIEPISVIPEQNSFNTGLLIGNSLTGSLGEIFIYNKENFKEEMIDDGFLTTSAEYIAAEKYFAQVPDTSEVIVYEANETVASTMFNNIIELNSNWYNFCIVSSSLLSSLTVSAVAQYVESSEKPMCFFFASSSADILDGDDETFLALKELELKRTFGFYSTNSNVVPAFVGLLSAYNTLADNSAYTAAYKTLSGVAAEDLTNTQLNAAMEICANVYCKFGTQYKFTYPCVSFGGYHVDEIFALDAAKFLIQQSAISAITSQRKVAQTDSGVSTIVANINDVCARLSRIGFIGTGEWRGSDIGSLKRGATIPDGFYIEANSVSTLSPEERAARKSPTINIVLLFSGAIEHVQIRLFVYR